MQRSGKSISLRVCNSTAIHTYTPWETLDRWYGGMTKMSPEAVSGVAKPMNKGVLHISFYPSISRAHPPPWCRDLGSSSLRTTAMNPCHPMGSPTGGQREGRECSQSVSSPLFLRDHGEVAASLQRTQLTSGLSRQLSLWEQQPCVRPRGGNKCAVFSVGYCTLPCFILKPGPHSH